MRASEFIVEDNESRTEEFQGVHMKIRDDGYEVVASALDDWGNEMGSVVFNKGDDNELDPQDLLVIDKYRGQGVAKVMYNYVKSKGYEIHKSPDVTKIADQGKQSGEHFWKKNRGDERVWEAFDQPYKTKSEKSEYGDVDMLAKLPDGTNLSIMFSRADLVDDIWGVEFYRNNSQEVTGEGDAQRIFATVLTAIQKFIKKYQPQTLFFTASKEIDPSTYYGPDDVVPNPESRAKLYDRLVQRYAKVWGYRALRGDTGKLVRYELTRLNQGVAEGLSEARNSLFAFVKQHFPTWPDYVLKDFLYPQAKGIRDQAELDDFLTRNKQEFGNCKWTLVKLPITFDIFTPKTQDQLRKREGGSKNPNQVPRDAERHTQQSQMIQQKGVSSEPIIVAKLANGYDLIEGWHRTIQNLKAFPQGYTGPAWVCTGATYKSESVQQGVAEDDLDEDWKSKLATGAVAGAMAMGASAKAPEIVRQTVEPGDTVYSIARQNNVNPLEIYKLNKMDRNTKLEVGQKVLVPDYSKPVSKMPATVTPAVKQELTKATPVAQSAPSLKDKISSLIPKFSNDKDEEGITLLSDNSEAEAALQTAAKAAGLKGVELAQFMAQTRHESWDFGKMKEVGNKKRFAKYETPRKARQLGNKVKGDGELFKGRGFIQLTGRDNYTRASQQIFGDDRLVKNPDLASRLDVGAQIALWFWKNQVRPNVTNFNNTKEVTNVINPGLSGLQDRHNKFKEYLAVL